MGLLVRELEQCGQTGLLVLVKLWEWTERTEEHGAVLHCVYIDRGGRLLFNVHKDSRHIRILNFQNSRSFENSKHPAHNSSEKVKRHRQ